MAERCDLTELLVDHCGHCRRDQSLEDQVSAEHAALLRTGRWMPAQFPGRCRCNQCGEPIVPGAPIQRDVSGWIGSCCADEEVVG